MKVADNKKTPLLLPRTAFFASKSGAGNETRTRDLLHGKQMLYQLSYSRIATDGALVYG